MFRSGTITTMDGIRGSLPICGLGAWVSNLPCFRRWVGRAFAYLWGEGLLHVPFGAPQNGLLLRYAHETQLYGYSCGKARGGCQKKSEDDKVRKFIRREEDWKEGSEDMGRDFSPT